MNIGIDVDGVIIDWEREIKAYAEIYDLLEVNGKGVINKDFFRAQDRYSWDEKTKNNFIKKYFAKASEECDFVSGSIDVLKELHKRKYKLFIISTRGRKPLGYMKDIVIKRFKENGLIFDKMIFGLKNKADTCKSELIDIMIDDNPFHAEEISKNKIKVLYFRDKSSKRLKENKYLKEVNNWGEILRFIINNKKSS